jgi:hypothetical protein
VTHWFVRELVELATVNVKENGTEEKNELLENTAKQSVKWFLFIFFSGGLL